MGPSENEGIHEDIECSLKKRRAARFKSYDETTSEWERLIAFLRLMIPRICYFPTFLFSFLEKIYLSNPPEDSTVNSYYVQIAQDILHSIDAKLSMQTHILDRIERTSRPNFPWDWTWFLGTDEKQQLDHVMLQLSNKVTEPL